MKLHGAHGRTKAAGYLSDHPLHYAAKHMPAKGEPHEITNQDYQSNTVYKIDLTHARVKYETHDALVRLHSDVG